MTFIETYQGLLQFVGFFAGTGAGALMGLLILKAGD